MTTNKALQAAETRGRVARLFGKPVTANPYGDTRSQNGGVTFARAFWRAWRRGWEEEDHEEGDDSEKPSVT